MPKYIGQKEVTSEVKEGEKIRFTLIDGSGNDVTKDQFKAIVSDTKYDDGEVRARQWDPAIMKMVEILLENDIKQIEIPFVIQRLMTTLEDKYDQATAKLFGAKYGDFVTLGMVDKVLKLDDTK